MEIFWDNVAIRGLHLNSTLLPRIELRDERHDLNNRGQTTVSP